MFDYQLDMFYCGVDGVDKLFFFCFWK